MRVKILEHDLKGARSSDTRTWCTPAGQIIEVKKEKVKRIIEEKGHRYGFIDRCPYCGILKPRVEIFSN